MQRAADARVQPAMDEFLFRRGNTHLRDDLTQFWTVDFVWPADMIAERKIAVANPNQGFDFSF